MATLNYPYDVEIKSEPSNKEIALRLVEGWVGQSGNPASFSTVCGNYKYALEMLEELDTSETTPGMATDA